MTQKNSQVATQTPTQANAQKNAQSGGKKPSHNLTSPKYWLVWLLYAAIYPLLCLPLQVQFWLGGLLGRLLFRLIKKRRQVAITNLKLCFKLSDTEAEAMAREVFIHAGVGFFESMLAWRRPQVFRQLFDKGCIHITGLEHLTQAQAQGKGILLQGLHSTMLDLGGLISSLYFGSHVVYRPQNNAALDHIVRMGRAHIFLGQIAFRDIKTMVKTLKNKKVVWYAPDQDYGLQHGVMAPFFGVPAATITAGRRIARMADASVMAIHFYRENPSVQQGKLKLGGLPMYHAVISPVVDNYPSKDELADATRINELLESLIGIAPAQYMWFHKRFKHDASGRSAIYNNL